MPIVDYEIYGFVSTVTPNYDAAIGILPQGDIIEESARPGVIHYGVDDSEERIRFGTGGIYYINMQWNQLSATNSGIIFDWYNDTAKADGCQRSFKYAWGDGHTYCVRFDCKLPRSGNAMSRLGIKNIRLKILGRIAD